MSDQQLSADKKETFLDATEGLVIANERITELIRRISQMKNRFTPDKPSETCCGEAPTPPMTAGEKIKRQVDILFNLIDFAHRRMNDLEEIV